MARRDVSQSRITTGVADTIPEPKGYTRIRPMKLLPGRAGLSTFMTHIIAMITRCTIRAGVAVGDRHTSAGSGAYYPYLAV